MRPGEKSSSVIPKRKLHLDAHPVCVGQQAEPREAKQPIVRLIEADGKIQAIEVTCVCGHKIHLDCIY